MAGHPVSRQVAQVTLEALKKAGHILLAPGGTEAVLRELSQLIDPVIPRVLAKLDFSPIMGEVSSTFGDEATDEAVEALVEEMREALLDSDGVEDVFADDRTIERMIFRTFAETSRTLARTAQEEDEDDELPPISVKLDTLGYVAAAAAKSADDGTLREALDRAAEAAQSELKTFDEKSLTAFFKPVDPDPDRRLDIESAIEEELSDLVDLGVVELPTVKRTLPLPALGDAERKTLRRRSWGSRALDGPPPPTTTTPPPRSTCRSRCVCSRQRGSRRRQPRSAPRPSRPRPRRARPPHARHARRRLPRRQPRSRPRRGP